MQEQIQMQCQSKKKPFDVNLSGTTITILHANGSHSIQSDVHGKIHPLGHHLGTQARLDNLEHISVIVTLNFSSVHENNLSSE